MNKVSFIAAGFIVLLIVAITSESLLIKTLPLLLMFFAMLLPRPEWVWTIAIALSSSKLLFPHLTTALDANNFVYALFIFFILLKDIMTPQRRRIVDLPLSHKFLAALALLSVGLAAYRGMGLRIFGSSLWGGGQYIVLWLSAGFLVASHRIHVSARMVTGAVWAMLLLATAPFAVEIGRWSFPVVFQHVTPFFGLGEWGNTLGTFQDPGEFARLVGVQSGGIALLQAALILAVKKSPRIGLSLALASAGLLILGAAGFRASFALSIMMAAIFVAQNRRSFHTPAGLMLILSGGLALTLLYIYAERLPFSAQRTISWLPGIQVDQPAIHSGEGTLQWRLQMWKELWPLAKKHLWIGRGLAFSLSEVSSILFATAGHKSIDFYIATHQYHNGPMYLLVDYGLLGLVFAFGFMWTSIRRHLALRHAVSATPLVNTMHSVLLSKYIALWAFFWLLHGAMETIVELSRDLAVLEMLACHKCPSTPDNANPQNALAEHKASC